MEIAYQAHLLDQGRGKELPAIYQGVLLRDSLTAYSRDRKPPSGNRKLVVKNIKQIQKKETFCSKSV